MSSKDFFEGLAALIESSFVLVESGGNMVNVLIILLGSGMMAWWIAQLVKYQKEAKKSGELE